MNYTPPTRSSMLDALINGKPLDGGKVYGQPMVDTDSGNFGGGYPHDTVVSVVSDGTTVTVKHADGTVNTFPAGSSGGSVTAADLRQETTDTNWFNSPSSYAQVAQAIRNGAAKIVFVGDSLLFGFQGGSAASAISTFARRLRDVFPGVAFTFVDRCIPGGTYANFIDNAYFPASSLIGTGSAVGTPGRDAWTTAFEEQTYRWPEGAASFVATAWHDVVQADAPDLLVFGLGFNDIAFGNDTLKNYRSYISNLFARVSAYTHIPSVCLVTETTGNPNKPASQLSLLTRDQLAGMNAITRLAARNLDWGIMDAGRAFERHVLGIDPQRTKIDVDRYLDDVTNATLWTPEYLTSSASALPVTGAGTSAVAIDPTGLHPGAGFGILGRRVKARALEARFTVNKLASDNDQLFLVFNASRSGTMFTSRKLQLVFKNTVGVGQIILSEDAVADTTVNLGTPFSIDGSAPKDVQVVYDGSRVRVWVQPNVNPNAPDMDVPLKAHAPGFPAIAYGNAVSAPNLRATNFVLHIGVDSPVRVADTTIAAFYGVGPSGEYFTNNRSLGGDTLEHPSSIGYQLMYEAPQTAVVQAIYLASQLVATGGFGGGFISGNIDFTVDPALNGKVVGANKATLNTVKLPGPTQAVMTPGFFVDICATNTGVVNIVPFDGSVSIVSQSGAATINSRYKTARCTLITVVPGVSYVWLVTQGEASTRVANGEALYLGCHFDGTNIIADQTTCYVIFANTASGILEFYGATGAVVGNTVAVTNRLGLTADGRLFGQALHNNANPVTGATTQYVASGTYTPTTGTNTNVAAVTMNQATWMRVGNVVTVSGQASITPTAAALTTLNIVLPIASAFTLNADLSGAAAAPNQTAANAASAGIFANTGAAQASLRWTAVGIAAQTWTYTYTYVVK